MTFKNFMTAQQRPRLPRLRGRASALEASLERRVTRSLHHHIQERLLPNHKTEGRDRHLQECIADAGVQVERVVRTRPDTRAILVTRHPTFGRCMLKTVSDTQQPHRALAQMALAEWLLKENPRIFPEVFKTTSAYTLERYIEGRNFRHWLAAGFDEDVVAEYFANLRHLVPPRNIYRWGEAMSSEELWAICEAYVRKCLGQRRYFSGHQQIASSVTLLRQSRHLSAQLERLMEACKVAEVPRGLMCGDMGSVNIIVQHGPQRMVNVDYEFLSPGYWGFDAAYLLSTLARWNDDSYPMSRMRQLVFDHDQMSPAARALFVTLTDVLTDVSRVIHGRHS